MGLIAVANFRPREWAVDEQSFAMALADAVVLSINQQRLYEKQRQLDTLMANLPGIAYRMRYDACGPALEYVSDGSLEMAGFTMEDVQKNPRILKDVILAEDLPAFNQAHMDVTELDGTVEVLCRIVFDDKGPRWILERGKLIDIDKDSGARTFEGFAHDISERMQLKEAELANEAKSNFLAAMSHEIRTPLNAIIGFTYFVRQTQMSVQQAEYLSKIDTSANILLELINTILDFSKIEAGKMEVLSEPFNLCEMLDGLKIMFHDQAERKGLALIIARDEEIPCELIGSPMHLKQILLNLMSNAVKFTNKGTVNVKCELAEKNADTLDLRFSVRDTGVGMSQDDLGRIFNAFVQADDSISRRYGGTGLGLSIAKSLVELLQSAISVESEPSKGTVFTFTGRLRENSAASANRQEDSGYVVPRFNGQSVLLVEDNEINREIAQTMLEDVNLKVTTAENGQVALHILAKAGPAAFALILMDIQMPVMDGLQATRLIRQMPGMAEVPIIAMTAHALDTEKKKVRPPG